MMVLPIVGHDLDETHVKCPFCLIIQCLAFGLLGCLKNRTGSRRERLANRLKFGSWVFLPILLSLLPDKAPYLALITGRDDFIS